MTFKIKFPKKILKDRVEFIGKILPLKKEEDISSLLTISTDINKLPL